MVGISDSTQQIVFFSDEPKDALLKVPHTVYVQRKKLESNLPIIDGHICVD